MVENVTGDLSRYAPGEWPQRPAVLTYDDGQIVDAWKSKERGDRIGKEVKAQLEYFGAWRTAVFNVEGFGASNLQLLMSVLVRLEHADDWEQVERVRAFVKQWYRFVPPAPMTTDLRWQARAAERFSENRRLLPIWLREMTRPPPGYSTREPAIEDTEPEAPAPQAELSFAGDE